VYLLIAANFLLQVFGAMHKDLNENIFLILVCVILLNMLLVFVEDWKFSVNFWLLMAIPFAVFLMMGVTVLFLLLSYGITAFPLPASPVVISVRATALIWSFVVESIGLDKLDTSDKDDQKKTIKETPKAEQQKL
jgi:hypothetical protein